jgi:hypothetical protein
MNVPVRIVDPDSDTRLEPVTPAPGDPLSYKCVGWTITTPPPLVPGPGEYAPSPALSAVLQTARCQNLPLQTITPRSPISTELRSSAANYAVNGSEFWSTVWYFKLRPIEFTLKSYCRCNVTLSLVMRTCLPFASAVAVIVNRRTLHTYNPSDDSWFTQHITIPAGFLEQGTNHIVLETPASAQTRLGIPLGIWVQSASVGWNPGLMPAEGA